MVRRRKRKTDEGYRQALADALDRAELRFTLTEGHVAHIAEEERKAYQRRMDRQRRIA